MSTRAVTNIKAFHLFDWTKVSWYKAEGMVHKMMSRSIWSHVFHKRCNVNSACVYYCSIVKELNDM